MCFSDSAVDASARPLSLPSPALSSRLPSSPLVPQRTDAPTVCCAVAAGLTVPPPVPLTTSPPAPTTVPTALLCTALCRSACCAWRQDGPASSRAFATGWLDWSIDARASSRTGACLEWAFAAASACPPVSPSSTTASARGVAGQGPRALGAGSWACSWTASGCAAAALKTGGRACR